MSKTFKQIKELVAKAEIKISDHGYSELAADNIFVKDIVNGVASGQAVEDYPNYPKGPCVLVLQKDHDGAPIHVVWGIPKNEMSPAVVVTAYRPDPKKWTDDYLRRK